MKKSFIRNIFLQISAIICSFFLISSAGCESPEPVKVVIHTDFGDMIIELSDSTPGHRDNFIKLANEGFLAKAPEAVVLENRRRLEEEQTRLNGLNTARQRIIAEM